MIVTIIHLFLTRSNKNSSTSAGKEPWSDVIDKIVQATALYSKAPGSDAEHHYSLLSFMYCSCILRHASLLFAVWSAKGWGPVAFATMLQPGIRSQLPPTLTHGDAGSWANLERLSSTSGISKTTIASTVSQLHGPWLLHLGPRERIVILKAMAGIYSSLGYKRKEAYVLREVLGCIMDLIVCGREEDGISQAAIDVSSTRTDPMLSPVGRGQVGIRLNESSDGNDSLLTLLKFVCRVLGVDLEVVDLLKPNDENGDKVQGDESLNQLEPFGWPELQVGVVREAVAVAEALPGKRASCSG